MESKNTGNKETLKDKIQWKWLAIIFIAFGLYLAHTSILLRHLLAGRTNYEDKPNSIEFQQPDILLSPYPFYADEYRKFPLKNKRKNIARTLKKLREIEKITVSQFKLTKINRTSRNMLNHYLWDSLNFKDFTEAFYYKNIRLYCGGRRVRKYQLELNFYHFLAIRIKPGMCKVKFDESSLVNKFYMHSYKVPLFNSTKPISLSIYNQTLRYFFVSNYEDFFAGNSMSMKIVPNDDYPRPTSDKVINSGGYRTDVYLNVKRIENLNKKSHRCIKTEFRYFYNLLMTNITQNPLRYTYHSTCKYIFMQTHLYRRFQCVYSRYPIPMSIPRNFKKCFDVKHLKTINKKRMLMMKMFIRQFLRYGEYICLDPCLTYKYSVRTNYVQYPRIGKLRSVVHSLKKIHPGLKEAAVDLRRKYTNLILWQKNFHLFTINANEENSTEVSEFFNYGLVNYLSDIGGLLGFYLGASIVTIYELLHFVWRKLKRKRKVTRKTRRGNDESKKDADPTKKESH